MRGRTASQSPIERVTCAGSGACVSSGATLLTGVAMHCLEAYLRVDTSLTESGLEHERAAVARPMANGGAPPLQVPGACAAFGPLLFFHLLFFLHDPPLAVKLALEPRHLVEGQGVGVPRVLGRRARPGGVGAAVEVGSGAGAAAACRTWLGIG